MTAFIAYYRLSTASEAVSGLGLEAQRAATGRGCQWYDVTVKAALEQRGGAYEKAA